MSLFIKKQTARLSNDKTIIEFFYRRENIVIFQWRANQLFASATGFGK